MYNLDGNLFDTIEQASKSSGIAKPTLENHIDDTWKDKKGREHSLTIEEAPLEVHLDIYDGEVYASHPALTNLYSYSVSDMARYLHIDSQEVLDSIDTGKPASNGYTFSKEVI